MTTTENEKGQGDLGTIIIISREEEPGPGTCSVNARVLNPFPGRAGDKEQSATPLHPFPPFRAAWAETHYPPPQSRPLPQENYHLELTSVKTSFWPPNLDQKS